MTPGNRTIRYLNGSCHAIWGTRNGMDREKAEIRIQGGVKDKQFNKKFKKNEWLWLVIGETLSKVVGMMEMGLWITL